MESSEKNHDDYAGAADIWGEFIDWEMRRKGEDGFLKKVLDENNCKKIFQSALGDGCDSIYLIQSGFDVVSNEISQEFIAKANENAKHAKLKLEITNFDWRGISRKMPQGSFDAILCVGNSLTHLSEKKDQLDTLNGFYHILRTGGVLIIDERNYDYILSNRDEILKGNFRYSAKYVYCGKTVTGKPVKIDNNCVVFEYSKKGFSQKYLLRLYPFKKGELFSLLKEAGFSKIEQHSDYKKGYNPDADFYTYVAEK